MAEIFGKNERNVVAEWYLNSQVRSLRQARFLIAVQAALDEVQEDFIVVANLPVEKRILVLAYGVATGHYNLDEVFHDRSTGSVIKMIREGNGIAVVNA